MAMIQCFMIAEPNWNLFVAAIAKASKRAEKLGMAPLTWELAPEFESLGDGSPVPLKAVALMGDIPETNDWRMVGRLEHLPDSSEALVSGNVPEHLRHDGPVCDHCQTNRVRNLTYVVRFGNGSAYKRVGKSCLGEFLQSDAAEKLSKYFDLLTSVIEQVETFRHYSNTGSPMVRYFEPQHVLNLAAVSIRTEGWVSVAEAERTGQPATAHRVLKRIDDTVTTSSEDDQVVDAVSAWLHSTEVEQAAADSPYLHNLRAMLLAGSVPGHKVGLMASAVNAWSRAQVKKEAAVVSQFVGELNKRCDFTVSLLRKTELYSEWGGKTLHHFVDSAGNKLVWFATGYSELKTGQTYQITAKVEKHQLYNDAFQTVLSRVTCHDLKLFDIAAKGDANALKKSLAKGLNVNVRDGRNRTPLHEAIESGHEAVVALFLEARACPDAKDRIGLSPLKLALANGYFSIVNLLLEAGAMVEPDMLELVPEDSPCVAEALRQHAVPC